MSKKYFLLILFIITLSLAACSAKDPQITLEYDQFEFGDVVNGEIAARDIVVQNTGGTPLIFESVSSSCGCTTATIDPMTIAPGEEGVLHIEFDSGAHGPELTGQMMRQVFLMSNDPVSPELMIEFTANVTK